MQAVAAVLVFREVYSRAKHFDQSGECLGMVLDVVVEPESVAGVIRFRFLGSIREIASWHQRSHAVHLVAALGETILTSSVDHYLDPEYLVCDIVELDLFMQT